MVSAKYSIIAAGYLQFLSFPSRDVQKFGGKEILNSD